MPTGLSGGATAWPANHPPDGAATTQWASNCTGGDHPGGRGTRTSSRDRWRWRSDFPRRERSRPSGQSAPRFCGLFLGYAPPIFLGPFPLDATQRHIDPELYIALAPGLIHLAQGAKRLRQCLIVRMTPRTHDNNGDV